METPLSTRRITRSLSAASQKRANAAAAPAGGGDIPPSRPALHDITNDSPIVGLATHTAADRTPRGSTAAAGAKTRARPRRTPGSGEALLRGQVKTLLQKVDEEGVVRPLRVHALLGVSRSPAQLLAPTPANTPQLGADSADRDEGSLLLPPDALTLMPCVLEEDHLILKLQVIAAPPSPPATEESLAQGPLNRALVFDDSPGKSDLSTDASVVSSSLTFQGNSSDRSPDDDSSSVWSIQVNVSSEKGDEDTVGELEEEYHTEDLEEDQYYTEEGWQEDDDDDDEECFDDLCEGMSKMSVFDDEEKKVGLPAFEGRHTRFVYNSDDEIVERKEVANAAAEHGALLRGLPVPEGKHLRFQDDDDDDDE